MIPFKTNLVFDFILEISSFGYTFGEGYGFFRVIDSRDVFITFLGELDARVSVPAAEVQYLGLFSDVVVLHPSHDSNEAVLAEPHLALVAVISEVFQLDVVRAVPTETNKMMNIVLNYVFRDLRLSVSPLSSSL